VYVVVAFVSFFITHCSFAQHLCVMFKRKRTSVISYAGFYLKK